MMKKFLSEKIDFAKTHGGSYTVDPGAVNTYRLIILFVQIFSKKTLNKY